MPFFPFPILKQEVEEKTCRGNESRCAQCPLFLNKTCPGCTAAGGVSRCRMASCEGQCQGCGGYKVDAPAICIKSPISPIMLPRMDPVQWDKIPDGRVVKATNRAVLVMNGGKRPMFRESIDPKRYADVEIVGVSLWRVWSTRGWFSSDLKDYLGIPNRVKLLVTTLIYDDALERATNSEVLFDLRDRKDIDLFHPLTYSIYGDHSVQNQYLAWRRTIRGMEESGGDFIQVEATPFSITDDVNRVVKKVPQVLFHLSMTTVTAKDDYSIRLRQRITFLHNTLPKSVSFWFMGPSSPNSVRACKRLVPGRQSYFLASSPWMASHKGHEFTKSGKLIRSGLPQDELTVRAFENYSFVVNGP